MIIYPYLSKRIGYLCEERDTPSKTKEMLISTQRNKAASLACISLALVPSGFFFFISLVTQSDQRLFGLPLVPTHSTFMSNSLYYYNYTYIIYLHVYYTRMLQALQSRMQSSYQSSNRGDA